MTSDDEGFKFVEPEPTYRLLATFHKGAGEWDFEGEEPWVTRWPSGKEGVYLYNPTPDRIWEDAARVVKAEAPTIARRAREARKRARKARRA